MADIFFDSVNQISKSHEGYTHKYPKYGKSTTDPTYYEPAATRIANMKKASGLKLEGIYDYYTKDDVSKFNEDNFKKNIGNAQYDPRFNNTLLREEISQVTRSYEDAARELVDDKKDTAKKKSDRINEAVETSKVINKVSENNSTEE